MRTEEQMAADLRKAQRKMARKQKHPGRAPFFNGWMIFATAILAAAAVVIAKDELYYSDAVTWLAWSCSALLAFGGRSYQYFIQKR